MDWEGFVGLVLWYSHGSMIFDSWVSANGYDGME